MSRSPADRLRRLRWLLTALFVAVNAIGVIVLAWLVINEDADRGIAAVGDSLDRVTSSVSRLVGYDGVVDFALVNSDELNDGCPQFAIMPGGAQPFQAHLSGRVCVPMDTGVLNGLATAAAQRGGVVTGYQRGTDGQLVLIRAQPLLSPNGKYFGAVVAVAGLAAEQAAHTRFTLLVAGSCVVLIAAAGFAGHVLSGRFIRPAAAAMQEQEVLLAETAHDLRTPVAALRALAETAHAHPDQRAALLPRTVQLASDMGSIIDSLLVRARLAAGVEQLNIQPVWLDQLVTDIVEGTQTGGAHVTVTAAPTKANADPTLIRRAIGNLLDNALRYGRQPGAEAIVHITVYRDTVTVADHGPGIDAATAADTFNRFNSTGGSSGLGLSIVRWVAQAHGGALSVYNADEGGAIFELRLPPSPA